MPNPLTKWQAYPGNGVAKFSDVGIKQDPFIMMDSAMRNPKL